MNEDTKMNLAQSLRADAQKRYDEAYLAARQKIINAVRSHFGCIQNKFSREKYLPEKAFSRNLDIFDSFYGKMLKPYMCDSHLTEMGFTKGEHYYPDERLATEHDYGWTTIHIPEVQENTPLTTAQTLYNEHVSAMEEIKQNIFKEDTKFVSERYPFAIPFVQQFVTRFRECSFSEVKLDGAPGLLRCSITLVAPDDLQRLARSDYYRDKDAFKTIRRYIYYTFANEGITLENGFSITHYNFENWSTTFRIEILVPFSTEQNTTN